MKLGDHRRVAFLLVVGMLLWAALVAGRVGAQAPEPWILYGHDIRSASTVTIDTRNGLARVVGSVGFAATSGSSLAAARAPVPSQGGVVYPEATIFGLLRDNTFNKDYVVVIDNETGEATKTVELDFTVSGRGAAFGPDGKTLYAFKPPGELYIIDTVTGALTLVGDVVDSEGFHQSGVSLQWDPDSGEFLALAGQGWNTLIRINPQNARATVIGEIEGMRACTILRTPGPVAGPGGTVLPEGTWFVVNTNTNVLHALSIDTVGGVIEENREVGSLGPNASFVCGTSFALPETPWVTPTLPGYPGYPGPTPSSVPPPGPGTSTPPSGNPSPTSTATSVPPPTDTPKYSQCICPIVEKRVPQVVILDALANPGRYYGWQYPLDQGKPPGPNNPPRECLTLQNVSVDYHPFWNNPIWRVGCP